MLAHEWDTGKVSANPPAACLGSRDSEASLEPISPCGSRGLRAPTLPGVHGPGRRGPSCKPPFCPRELEATDHVCPGPRAMPSLDHPHSWDQPTPFFTDKKQAQLEDGPAQILAALLFSMYSGPLWHGGRRVHQAYLLFQSPWLKGGKWSRTPLVTWPCSLRHGRKNGRWGACFGITGRRRSCLLS